MIVSNWKSHKKHQCKALSISRGEGGVQSAAARGSLEVLGADAAASDFGKNNGAAGRCKHGFVLFQEGDICAKFMNTVSFKNTTFLPSSVCISTALCYQL